MLGKFPFDDPTLPHLSVLDSSKTETLTYSLIVHLAATFCPTLEAEDIKEEWEDLQLLPANAVSRIDPESEKAKRIDMYWGEVMALKTAVGVPRFP
ncbi:hypothetical protein PoB_006875400 [Plakobranchus ocellatus]|uniref:Uncharacterized protein n=1 Tax=Plakobranchus ocellatus TaxID=259542 RepID=A0AAV4DDI3_9GAST|nr:hypothetical protein PoB_006875400 [Plakobranchus ocellatus]